MDKIARVRQEIERLKKYYAECGYPGMGEYEQGNKQGRLDTLDNILTFLDTLSEESDKSLEEEMKRFIDAHYHTRFDETLENGNDPLTVFDFEDIARHFAEWQKSQMLKDAVEGRVEAVGPTVDGDPSRRQAVSYACKNVPFCMLRDKVRILVLKEEE